MRLVSLNGAEQVTHPQFGTATVGEDGVFDVPEDFGRALIAVSATWRDEAVHVAELARRERAELQDPRKALDVLATLRSQMGELRAQLAASTDEARDERISELEAQVAALTEQLAADPPDHDDDDDDEDDDDEDEDDGTSPVEPAKAAPMKKATAKKTSGKRTSKK